MNNEFHLGSKIRKYRHLAGMTQEELAEYSNLSVNYISKIEREKKQNISIEEMFDDRHNVSIRKLPPNAVELITYLKESDNPNIDKICEQLLNLMRNMNQN